MSVAAPAPVQSQAVDSVCPKCRELAPSAAVNALLKAPETAASSSSNVAADGTIEPANPVSPVTSTEAACRSCCGLLQEASLPARLVDQLAKCIGERGYDATLYKLEFMTKEFEQIQRPIGNGSATPGSPFPSLARVKDEFRRLVKEAFNNHSLLAHLQPREPGQQGALLISVRIVDKQVRSRLQQQLLQRTSSDRNPRKRGRFNRKGGKNKQRGAHASSASTLSRNELVNSVQNSAQEVIPEDHQSFTLEDVSEQVAVNIRVFREPVLVFGRYIKCSRRLSQTPWVINGQRKGISSVEEALAGPILDQFRPTTFKFHSAGREDFNVRMCGNGRPFILELIDATIGDLDRTAYAKLERHMNNADECPTATLVRVNSLRPATIEFDQLKEGAETKRKSYSCVVWVSKALQGPADLAGLDATKELIVIQTTPIRVAHRRSLMERPKVIHSMVGFVSPGQTVVSLLKSLKLMCCVN
eukprot:INCI7690.6.p1 GENE.INCI7690.6~~INCI7690.6.p1  ORF type:complete len:555 (-),score=69.87 INCI7690.6:527-1945(-)